MSFATDTAADDRPSRRRSVPLRLSLRGLLILISAFCVWAAYHGKWIRDRREARLWIVAHEDGPWSGAHPTDVRVQQIIKGRQVWIADRAPALPWSLRILGERPLHYINLDKSKLTVQDVDRIDDLQMLFPEADGVHIQEPLLSQRWPPEDVNAYFDRRFFQTKVAETRP